MVCIIVASHGKLAQELVNSSFMIFGEQNNVYSIGFFPGEGTNDLNKKYNEILEKIGENESVILADLFGGSPFNVGAAISNNDPKVSICSGVNLGMLLEAYGLMSEDSSEEIIKKLSKCGKDSIKIYQENLNEEDEYEGEEL